jgi:hypothetical protein
MPTGVIREIIPAPRAEVFRLLHDYDRRLEWDTLLQEAYLSDGCREAQLGAVSVCRGRADLGGIALETRYISFRPPEVAAVQMVNLPPFFASFAASIRHQDLGESRSSVEYRYYFTARPHWLRFLLHPLMNVLLARETRKRFRALRRFFEPNVPTAFLKR